MIYLISGTTHTGKTALAQKMCECFNVPYLSIDHLKMGLIRSKQTNLTVFDDDKLCDYLWPIVREMMKTAIENKQHIIIEGCYIPFNWKDDFDENYLNDIKYVCLVFSENYIQHHFHDIKKYANVVENRMSDDLEIESIIDENKTALNECIKHNYPYVLINNDHNTEINEFLTHLGFFF